MYKRQHKEQAKDILERIAEESSEVKVLKANLLLGEGKDLDDNRPHQYEFNKLNLSYTLMSKRNLLTLVKEGLVNGWDEDVYKRQPEAPVLPVRAWRAPGLSSLRDGVA